MTSTRKQLTFFISPPNESIETIRSTYDPIQKSLIDAHITLCRDEEMDILEQLILNIRQLKNKKPLTLQFGTPQRFNEGKGLWLPATGNMEEYHELRKSILNGIIETPREPLPHITLIHPRNASCTDDIFNTIMSYSLPAACSFTEISLIEQRNGGKWELLDTFALQS